MGLKGDKDGWMQRKGMMAEKGLLHEENKCLEINGSGCF